MSVFGDNRPVLPALLRLPAVALCVALLLAPAIAKAEAGLPSDAAVQTGEDSVMEASGHNEPKLEVCRLADLGCTLSPMDRVEQSIDPAIRVTITGTGWRLYVTWEAAPRATTASIRTAGSGSSWRTMSAQPILIATAPDSAKNKTRTTIELAVKQRIGANGTDPWSVSAGEYSGCLVFRLEDEGSCGSDGFTGSASDEPSDGPVSNAPALETSAAEVPSAAPSPTESTPASQGIVATSSPDATGAATPATGTPEPTESGDLNGDQPIADPTDESTASAGAKPAEPSEEASATAPVGETPEALPNAAHKRLTQRQVQRHVPPKGRLKRPVSHAATAPPDLEDKQSGDPTATVEPEPDPAPAAP